MLICSIASVDAFQFSMTVFGKDRFISCLIIDAHLQYCFCRAFPVDHQDDHQERSPKLMTDSMSEDACYSLQEISQHNSSISFWIAIHSKVYDVTEFIHKVVQSEVMLTYLFIVAIILYTFAPHSTQEEQKY